MLHDSFFTIYIFKLDSFLSALHDFLLNCPQIIFTVQHFLINSLAKIL